MHAQADPTERYISLTEVAKLAPGRPSTNCVWRWCRKGVKSRTGERVRLQHVRIGGMIFTSLMWLDEFGRKLADADAQYFDLCNSAGNAVSNWRGRATRPSSQFEKNRREQIEQAERELNEAGV